MRRGCVAAGGRRCDSLWEGPRFVRRRGLPSEGQRRREDGAGIARVWRRIWHGIVLCYVGDEGLACIRDGMRSRRRMARVHNGSYIDTSSAAREGARPHITAAAPHVVVVRDRVGDQADLGNWGRSAGS